MKIASPARLFCAPRAIAWTLLGATLVAASLVVAAPSSGHSDPTPIQVTVRAEGEALARGFEEAYRALPNAPIYLTYTREDKGFVTLSGIRALRAVGAVLVVTLDRGPTFALPARSIVVLTDERPATP